MLNSCRRLVRLRYSRSPLTQMTGWCRDKLKGKILSLVRYSTVRSLNLYILQRTGVRSYAS